MWNTRKERKRDRGRDTQKETGRRKKERECMPVKERESKSWKRSARKRRSGYGERERGTGIGF